MVAATKDAAEWWAKSRGPQAPGWIEQYQSSLQVRHRTLISQIVGELQPETLLEVGCHCGPNLIRLCQDHPQLECAGFDPSTEAIQAGQHWVQSVNLQDRIDLRVGEMPQALYHFKTGLVDVVLACFTLSYLAPDDLPATLYELGRIAKRAVIIAEPMNTGSAGMRHSLSGYREWHHDYASAAKWIGTLSGCAVRSADVVPPVDGLNKILVWTRESSPSPEPPNTQ